MAIVAIQINGREYHLACDDGQEEGLRVIGQDLDDRVRLLARSAGSVGESTLFLLTAVTLCDELNDASKKIRELRQRVSELLVEAENDGKEAEQARVREMEAAMAATLDDVAERISRLSGQLEGSG